MNLIPGLHQFLFQVEKHFGEARLLFREREHCLIHNFESQRSLDAFAAPVRHAKTDPRLAARLVDRLVRGGLDPELIGWLHEDHMVIAGGSSIAPEHVRVQVQRARHSGCRRQVQVRGTVDDIEIMSGDCLPVFHHV